jgi:hypothetical protein
MLVRLPVVAHARLAEQFEDVWQLITSAVQLLLPSVAIHVIFVIPGRSERVGAALRV